MNIKKLFKFKISSKIFLAFLAISILSLIVFGHIAFENMRVIGEYAVDRSTTLGENAVNDSIDALKMQAEEYLLQLAKGQAGITNALLNKVRDEVMIIVAYASDLWTNQFKCEHRDSYSQDEEPENIYKASVYKLAPGVSMEEVKNELNYSSRIDDIFIPIFANDLNIHTLCMGTETGIFRSYPWRSGRDPSYDPRERDWYKRAVREAQVVWTEPYIHAATKELIITCAKSFYNDDKQLCGVVEADVTLTVMNDKIMSTEVGDSGYVFIIDKKGNVIARPGLNAGDTGWDETYKTENFLKSKNEELRKAAMDMISGKTGVLECSMDDGEKYIAYAPLTATDWFLGIVMPVDEIIAAALHTEKKINTAIEQTNKHIDTQIKSMQDMLTYILTAIMVLVFFIAYKMSKKITRPILSLADGVKVIGKGDLDYSINVNTNDEIEELAESFNKMARDLKNYIENLKKTTAEKERIQSELKVAHDIQMNIVRKAYPPFPDRKELDIYAFLTPAKEVGGDFYDFFFIDSKRLCFVIGDVSGKGVPAALFMAMTITLIKATAKEIKTPDKIMEKVNKELCEENDSRMFVTVFMGILDIETGEVSYINSGHNPPLLIKKDKEPEYLNLASNTVVGILEDLTFKCDRVILEPGDSLYMYTDGVTEAFASNGELFSEERLKEEISTHKEDDIKALVENMMKKVKKFSKGIPQSDDITMLVLKYFKSDTV